MATQNPGADPEGVQGVSLNPPPCPLFFKYNENEIIWSHWDQIISFLWDIYSKKREIKSAKLTSLPFIHMNPLSRNPGSAPETYAMVKMLSASLYVSLSGLRKSSANSMICFSKFLFRLTNVIIHDSSARDNSESSDLMVGVSILGD